MDNLSNYYDLFPLNLRTVLIGLSQSAKNDVTEIRIRRLLPIIIYLQKKPYFISSYGKLVNYYSADCLTICDGDFDYIINNICNYSFHSKVNSMLKGYVTTEKGSRIGIASKAVYKDNTVTSVKEITSINIRIPKEIKDCSRKLLNILNINTTPCIIIAGAPASGKTTLLRDMARLLSSGFAGKYMKVTVIDERDEIASGFDVGINTDVIRNFSKASAIEMAVRTLSPEIIICDEIGNEKELESIKFGFSTGTTFIVSVHAKNENDIFNNKIINSLVKTEKFDYLVLLKDYTNSFDIYDLTEDSNESNRKCPDNDIFFFHRNNNSEL